MTEAPTFERSVFINCPFDKDFEPLLLKIAFCVADLGFFPRIATENADNSASRLDRVLALVRGSKYGIHDLSRCRASEAGEYARMNMPFELGIDHAGARFGMAPMNEKAILILEESPRDFHKCLSDISGWDIHAHKNDHTGIVRIVSEWLIRQAKAAKVGAARIEGDYITFLEWHSLRERAQGASDSDILAYQTIRIIDAMGEWIDAGKPMKP
jgi:hypothetical protein